MSTAGYSGTPLPRKLGIKPGHSVALVGAPDGFIDLLEPLPGDTRVRHDLRGGPFDVIVAFFFERGELVRRLPGLRGALKVDGGLWLAWPKRASGVSTDLSDGVVRELGLAAGLVDNKVAALDATWSGLRLVYRLRDRPSR